MMEGLDRRECFHLLIVAGRSHTKVSEKGGILKEWRLLNRAHSVLLDTGCPMLDPCFLSAGGF